MTGSGVIADKLVILRTRFRGVTMDDRPKLLAEVNEGFDRANRAKLWSQILLLVALATVVLVCVVPSYWALASCGVLVVVTLAGAVSNFMARRREAALNDRIDAAMRAKLADLHRQQGRHEG